MLWELYKSTNSKNELNNVLQNQLELDIKILACAKCICIKVHYFCFGSCIKEWVAPLPLIEGYNSGAVPWSNALGVSLNEQRTWSCQFDKIVAKRGTAVSVIRRCAYFLTDHSDRQIIQSLVLSHLDYCSVVWSSATKNNLHKLQLVQNKAIV